MRNFYTFCADNPSNSFLSKQQQWRDTLKSNKPNPFTRTSLTQKQQIHALKGSQNQFQSSIMRNTTNIQLRKNRATSQPKQEYFYSSRSPQNRISNGYDTGQKNIQYFERSAANHNFSCQQLLYLIKNQRKCIEQAKQLVESDKSQVETDFSHFKQAINNAVDDLKFTIFTHLDNQYKHFVNQFNTIKTQYAIYCDLKKRFWQQNQGVIQKVQKNYNLLNGPQYPGLISNGNAENQKLVLNLIGDLKDCKKHKNYKQFQEVQFKYLKPLTMTAKSMVRQLNIQSYYHPEVASDSFNRLHKAIQQDLHKLNDRMDLFMVDFMNKQNNNFQTGERPTQKLDRVKSQDSKYKTQTQFCNMKSPYQFSPEFSAAQKEVDKKSKAELRMSHKYNKSVIKECTEQRQLGITKQKYSSTADSQNNNKCQTFRRTSKRYQCDQVYENKMKRSSNDYEMSVNKPAFNSSAKSKTCASFKNGYNERYIVLDNARCFTDSIINSGTFRAKQQSQTAICLALISNQSQLAVGTKNGIVKIFCTKSGAKVTELHAHKSSVCSLSAISCEGSSLLASGGDIGCTQLIIWDLNSYSINHIFDNYHRQAITSIVDFEDGKHFVSGSFDASINIYNSRKKQIVKSVKSVDKIVLLAKIKSSEKQWLVSGHLSSQISLWNVLKNSFNNVVGLELAYTISINTIPYSIMEAQNNAIVVSGKDGKVRTIGLNNFKILKQNSIGQCLQLIPLSQKPNSNIIGLGCMKDGRIAELGCQNNEVWIKQSTGGQNRLGYGCGVCSKAQISQNCVYIANHSTPLTEINVWSLRLAENYGFAKATNTY